jgi:multicomponent Na+:H+ antiporter subunit E
MTKIFSLILFTFMLMESYSIASLIKCICIVLASARLAHLLYRKEKHDAIGLKISSSLFIYLSVLAKEVFLSTVSVCKAIFFTKKSDLQPVLTEIKTNQKTDEAKVLLGNSITLTPGTVTIDIQENKIIVHAISAECLPGCKGLDLKIMKSQR